MVLIDSWNGATLMFRPLLSVTVHFRRDSFIIYKNIWNSIWKYMKNIWSFKLSYQNSKKLSSIEQVISHYSLNCHFDSWFVSFHEYLKLFSIFVSPCPNWVRAQPALMKKLTCENKCVLIWNFNLQIFSDHAFQLIPSLLVECRMLILVFKLTSDWLVTNQSEIELENRPEVQRWSK